MGEEKRKRLVPFFRPYFDRREMAELERIIKRGYLTQGVVVKDLEKAFSNYVGGKYGIATSSCTSALFLSLKAAGVGPGDVVAIPSLTFASVANVILHCGATIEFLDEVHVGHAYYLNNERLFKVVDSAHEIERGMYYDHRDALVCYSFYPTKQISSAEGGMIVLNDFAAMEWLDKAKWHGRQGKGFDYQITMAGWKMNMTDVQAALALVQLAKLDDMNRRRKAIVDHYNQELKENVDNLHLYTIDVNNRDDFVRFMDANGINCSVHFYTPLHMQPAFKRFHTKPMPVTEAKAKSTVSLPLFPNMYDDQIELVIEKVKAWRENESS